LLACDSELDLMQGKTKYPANLIALKGSESHLSRLVGWLSLIGHA
jgi:hypothetical protein